MCYFRVCGFTTTADCSLVFRKISNFVAQIKNFANDFSA